LRNGVVERFARHVSSVRSWRTHTAGGLRACRSGALKSVRRWRFALRRLFWQKSDQNSDLKISGQKIREFFRIKIPAVFLTFSGFAFLNRFREFFRPKNPRQKFKVFLKR